MDTTCINCPMGCSLHIEKVGEEIKVSGNVCKRGEKYGISEYTCPERMITTLVKGKDGVLSVKTTNPVAKSEIFNVLEEIKKLYVEKDVKCGDIICQNVANSGADVVITSNI